MTADAMEAAVAPTTGAVPDGSFAILARGLNHAFGNGDAAFHAIHDVTLGIERGKLTILMGPSGSGKTTLLTLFGCLRDVQTGSVRLLDQELRGASKDMQVKLRQRLGFIFQAHNLHDSLSARHNTMLGLQVKGIGDARFQHKAAAHMLGLVGLDERVDHMPSNLSGGQKQRVAVARALVGNPEIVFADEPTAALDKVSGLRVVEILKTLGHERGTTTVMVTHDNRISDLADRIITLEDGRIVEDTAPVPV